MRFIALALALIASLTALPAAAATFQSNSPYAFMKDVSTNQVLFEKNADARIPPASMAKMMTAYVAFEMIKRGDATLGQIITVRPETWQKWHGPKAGSTMFLSAGERVSLEDLLHGVVTVSGNDACVALAEGLAGSEQQFVDAMNAAAKRLGLKNSHFANSNGWPDPNGYSSARDLATIAEATIRDHPQLYKQFYGQKSFTWGKTLGSGQPITQPNRDPILGRVDGADGLKTGHTEEAGYGFTGSAVQKNRRLVMMVGGLTSMSDRTAESVRFMDWGFGSWKIAQLARAGTAFGETPVADGAKDTVGMMLPRDLKIALPAGFSPRPTTKVVPNKTLTAPIAKGQVVGSLIISARGAPSTQIPLVATEAVAKAGFFRSILLFGRGLFQGDTE